MNASEQNHLSGWFHRFEQAVAGIVFGVGAMVILGWLFDLRVLKGVLPGLTAMKANTAFAFILSGIALWGIQTGCESTPWRHVSRLCSVVVLLLGLLTLGEYMSGAAFGIDQLLIREITNLPGDIPGRMAVNTAISFVALGAALLLLSLGKDSMVMAIHTLSVVPIVAAGSALIGYAYNIEGFLREQLDYTPMALNTAALILLLASGVITARPDYPLRRFMSSDSAAGLTVRRLLPAAIGFTIATGWLILKGYQADYFSETFALALFTAANIAGLGALILWNAKIFYEVAVQRERAQEQQDSASQYARSLIEASLDPLVTISAEGKITDVNEATVKATGVAREALIGSDFSEYFTEPDKARAGYQQVFAKGFVTDYPLALRHASGKVTEVLYNASLYRNNKGEVAGVFAAARDITVRKRAEEERLSTLLYARNLIEASLDPLVTISAEGKITDVNDATIQATGVPRETLLGSDFSEYFTEPNKARAGYQEVFARGFVTDYPLTLRHISGKLIDVLYNASLYHNDKGEVAGVFATARDITERKRTDRELRAASLYARSLIEASADPLVTISADGKILDVNDATIKATGLSRLTLLGSDFSEYFTEPDKARAGYEEVFAKGFVTDYPLTLRHVSGKMIDVLYNASLYRNDKGEVAGVFAAARDITERKRAEEALRAASMYARSLLEASLDPLVTISVDGKITDVNEATVQATGVSRRDLIGSDFSDYFTEPNKARAGYEEVFAKGFVTDYPLTLRHVSGKMIEVLYNASLYRNDKGEVAGVFAAARDITGRKQAEDRNRYLAAIVESSDDAIIGKSLDGIITSWNKGAETMYGYMAKEVIGRPLSLLIPPSHEDELPRMLEKIRAGEHIDRFETLRRKKNGEDIHVSLTISPIRESGGAIIGAATVARDITERKRAEEELRTAALYARSLIEASLDPLVTISAEGKITDVNEATVQITGIPRKLLIGSDFSEYFTDPDKARAGYQEVFAKGFVTDYPLTLRHVSGRVKDVLYNASVYRNVKGEVAGVFAAARDISERKQAEHEVRKLNLRNQLILDSAGEGIYGVDMDGLCTFANPAASQMLGFTVYELIGQHCHFTFHHTKPDGSPYPQEECPVLSAYTEGTVHRGGDIYWRKDGSSFPVEFISTPIRETGKITGAVVAFRDMTESKQAEEELRKYHEELEELVLERTNQLEVANKDLEGFAYSVSHDLRVPLRAIDGFSRQVLKRYEDKLDAEGARYLNIVRDNTKKMSRLIDDILAFSRMGRLGMSVSEIDMQQLVSAVFEELKPSFAERDLSYEIKPLPVCQGDQSMLHQVWVNLLGNAIKFTQPKAAAQVEVGGHVEGEEVIYYVKDNGAGFDMQYADKLFGVFQRLHGVEEFEGTGAGLAIVKRIITRHGGRVWAEGKVNEGATFYFALPI